MQTRFPSPSHRLLTALTLGATCGIALAQAASPTASNPSRGSEQVGPAMKSGMDNMAQMKMTGDVDKDFAMMMKMHHQQAVEMANTEVAQGKSPQIKAMAAKMMKDQTKEIAQLDAWL